MNVLVLDRNGTLVTFDEKMFEGGGGIVCYILCTCEGYSTSIMHEM